MRSVFAQERTIQSFIPSNAIGALIARPKSALAQPALELVPHELIKVFGDQELGLDLLEIAELLVVMDEITDETMQTPPDMGLVVRFEKPQTLKTQITDDMVPRTISGRSAYFDRQQEFGIVLADEKTLVFGASNFLETLLSSQPSNATQGRLQKSFDQMASEDHMMVVFHVEAVRDLIRKNIPPRSQIPPPLGEFAAIPELVQTVQYRANFSNESRNELIIEANNERDAARLVRIVNNAIEIGKGAALTGIASQDAIPPAYEEAMVAYADRFAEVIVKLLEPKMDGNRLIYDMQGKNPATAYQTATIGVLVAMLLPAVQQVREAARRSISQNNLRQIGIALHNYESVHDHLPQQANYNDQGKPLLSWRVHLLPFLEQQALYNQFKLDEPWNSEHNIKLLDKMPEVYNNPNAPSKTKTLYLAVSGRGTTFPGDSNPDKKITFRDFIRGTSNTAIFLEVNADQAVEWTKPEDWQFDQANPFRGLGRLRPGGFSVGLADASVQFLRMPFDEELWSQLIRLK
jgi:type II secretory pathway pseudopilin PulG